MFVQSYSRLGTAGSVLTISVLTERKVPPSLFWENTDLVMTDAATKNLSIQELISEAFHSDHQPYHLRKSHNVEATDC